MASKRRAGRPKSPRVYVTDAHPDHPDWGQEFGLDLTSLDRQRLTALGRWYTLSLDNLVRLELAPEHWHPDHTDLPPGAGTDAYASTHRAIRRRLARLARIQPRSTQVGPLVAVLRGWRTRGAYYPTRYGATAAQLPWDGRDDINPDSIEHAWFAADLGLQIERTGAPVLSQRELTSGITADWIEVGRRFDSTYETREGKRISKQPDVVIPSPHSTDYIAVEAERHRRRSIAGYIEKLQAYRDNTDVRAVWFVCESDTTADRVGDAAEAVFGAVSNFPLRIRVAENRGDFYELPNLTRDGDLLADLQAIGYRRTPGNGLDAAGAAQSA